VNLKKPACTSNGALDKTRFLGKQKRLDIYMNRATSKHNLPTSTKPSCTLKLLARDAREMAWHNGFTVGCWRGEGRVLLEATKGGMSTEEMLAQRINTRQFRILPKTHERSRVRNRTVLPAYCSTFWDRL
jgi:hypothetical protein